MKKAYCWFVLLLVSFTSQLPATPVGFLFFGDFGTGSKEQKQVALGMKTFCEKSRCDFVVGLGDNIYEKGVQSTSDPQWQTKFRSIYDPLGLVFYASLGNHDYLGNPQAQIDYSDPAHHWYMPSRYFTFTKGNIDFFAIDTNNFATEQQKWLGEKLAGSKARWKIVYGHHPIYSYGYHGETAQLKKDLLPILIKNKVDLYLCGHEHNRQVMEADGIRFIISGATAKRSETGSGDKSLFHSADPGFAHLLVENDKASLTVLGKAGAVDFSREWGK